MSQDSRILGRVFPRVHVAFQGPQAVPAKASPVRAAMAADTYVPAARRPDAAEMASLKTELVQVIAQLDGLLATPTSAPQPPEHGPSDDGEAPAPAAEPAPQPTPEPQLPVATAEKPRVIDMPSPNLNERPAGTTIDTIVLHHTASAGSAEDVGRYFQNPAAEVSAHYTIGKDGTIVQSVPDDKRAWQAGRSQFHGRDNVNDFSLGIELVNLGNGQDPYTDEQYEALAKLLAFQVKTYGIPLERITGHRDVSLEGKVDPSDNFDWNRVRGMVQEKLGAA